MKINNLIFYILFLFWQSNMYSQQKEVFNNQTLSKLIKQHSWRIDSDLTKLKDNDSTFMMSNTGNETMWKYIDKKTHYDLNGDIQFTKNGKIKQLLRNSYSGKEIKIWKEVGSYIVSDSILNIFCLNKVIKLNCKILSKDFIDLKVISVLY